MMSLPAPKVLLSAEQIAARVAEIGAQVDADHPDGELVLVCVLRGAMMFFADLSRAISRPVLWDCIGLSSYGDGRESSGEVRLTSDLAMSVGGRQVVIVEDIVDTGRTMAYLVAELWSRGAAQVRIATLLDKPSRREMDVTPTYVGFVVPDCFVVGYGLDAAQQYRNLPFVGVLEG